MERLFDVEYDRSGHGPAQRRASDRALGPVPPVRPRPPLASDPRRPVRHPVDDRPLTSRLRPRRLEEFVGQQHLLGPGRPLRGLIERGQVPPLVLWGPAGTGKSTLAQLIASRADAAWVALSPAAGSADEVARVIQDAARRRRAGTGRTLVFLDDVHRCPPGLQEALLPLVEEGSLLLVGATTENPFFELDAPLVARCKLVQFHPLEPDDLLTLLDRAITDPDRGVGPGVEVTKEARRSLVSRADGSARKLLDGLEAALAAALPGPGGELLLEAEEVDASAHSRGDRDGGGLFDEQMAAFVGSLRGDDPDAAVYWLLRLLEAGGDPRSVARTMVVFASEDVGMADRQALSTAVATADAVDRVGLPGARLHLVHAALVLATAAKSDSVAQALSNGLQAVEEAGAAAVPDHLRRDAAPSPDGPEQRAGYVAAGGSEPRAAYHLPDQLHGRHIYEPRAVGDEAAVADQVAAWRDHIDAASSRLHAARARHQGGFIEGLGRATWRDETRQDQVGQDVAGQGQDGRGTDPRDFGRDA